MYVAGILLGVGAALVFTYIHVQWSAADQETCTAQSEAQQLQCLVEVVIESARMEGIGPAVGKVSALLQQYPALQNECHAIMHRVGEEAYSLYATGVPLEVDTSITMCTYGFYHGFITAAVTIEGSFAQAQAFCASVNAQLAQKGFNTELECYHGFGHAVVDDHVAAQFSNAHAVASNALSLCDELAENTIRYQNCAGGVYNAIANIFVDGTFAWPEIAAQDGTFCEDQPSLLQETCYGYFARVILASHAGDFPQSLLSMGREVADTYKSGVIENLALMYMVSAEKKTAFTDAVVACKEIVPAHAPFCIAGLAVGVMQSAKTGEEFSGASAVCTFASLTEKERSVCFARVLENGRMLVSHDTFMQWCALVPEPYVTVACRL